MNQKRELTTEDWRTIRNALDLLLRCKLGQLDEAFNVFYFEIIRREEKKEPRPGFASALARRLRDLFKKTTGDIATILWGSPNASYGVENLDDHVRQLIIQSDLRLCKCADDLSKCLLYPEQCASPTTGFCPKDPEKGKKNGKEEC